MPTEQQILSEEQLIILVRAALVMAQRVCHARFCDPHPLGQAEVCKTTTEGIEQFDALCQTVRALRELAYIPKILPNDEMITYRDQVERLLREKSDLKSRLSEVEKERDAMHAAIATALRT